MNQPRSIVLLEFVEHEGAFFGTRAANATGHQLSLGSQLLPLSYFAGRVNNATTPLTLCLTPGGSLPQFLIGLFPIPYGADERT